MSGNVDDPESTIPWPGFVDILSTVIIVFVFFMMMTSVIIFMMSQESTKKAVEKAKQDAKTERSAEESTTAASGASTDISEVLKENKALKAELNKLGQLKSVLAESTTQTTEQTAQGAVLQYGDFGVTLTEQTTDVIKKMLPLKGRVVLTSVVSSNGNYGATREIALNRALNIRNTLIQNGVPAANIALKITTEDQQTTTESTPYGRVIIEQQP